jgi:hypothetical protein
MEVTLEVDLYWHSYRLGLTGREIGKFPDGLAGVGAAKS